MHRLTLGVTGSTYSGQFSRPACDENRVPPFQCTHSELQSRLYAVNAALATAMRALVGQSGVRLCIGQCSTVSSVFSRRRRRDPLTAAPSQRFLADDATSHDPVTNEFGRQKTGLYRLPLFLYGPKCHQIRSVLVLSFSRRRFLPMRRQRGYELWPCVCQCLCPSVTSRSSIETAERIDLVLG